MPVTFKIKGLDKTIKKFRDFPNEIKQEVDDELTATAYNIDRDAKLFAPVDLGKLKNSIEVTRNEPLLKQISATADYAAYVEFGTGSLVNIPSLPEGLQEYAIQFKGKGVRQVNLPARPYLFPAVQSNTVELVKRLKNIIEQEAKKP